MIKENTVEQIKTAADATSLTLTLGAFLEWLPHIAALLSVVWVLIRICEACITVYEKETVQRLLGRRGGTVDPARAHIPPSAGEDKHTPP